MRITANGGASCLLKLSPYCLILCSDHEMKSGAAGGWTVRLSLLFNVAGLSSSNRRITTRDKINSWSLAAAYNASNAIPTTSNTRPKCFFRFIAEIFTPAPIRLHMNAMRG